MTARISLTPESTAENATNRAPVLSAISDASVVLPVPGGPQRIIEWSSPRSIAVLSTLPGPKRCSWPTTSSSVRGRMRSASGALAGAPGSVRSASPQRPDCAGEAGPRRAASARGFLGFISSAREEIREVPEVAQRGHRVDLPAGEVFGLHAVGDEGDAGGGGGHAVDPGVADHVAGALRPTVQVGG